jgi:hypothetical protein
MTASGIETKCGLTQDRLGLAGETVNDAPAGGPDPSNMRRNTPSAIPPYAGYVKEAAKKFFLYQ